MIHIFGRFYLICLLLSLLLSQILSPVWNSIEFEADSHSLFFSLQTEMNFEIKRDGNEGNYTAYTHLHPLLFKKYKFLEIL